MLLTSLKIEHYRGIKALELALGPTTVLVGENNCGKTTVLHALRACLYTLRSAGRASPFEEFDLHFDSKAADPTTAPPIVITLTFEEANAGEWSDEVEQRLGGDGGVIALMPPDDRSRVQLRVTAQYSPVTQEIETVFEFLDAAGNPLPAKNRGRLTGLQQLRPLFYLSALRDAGKEFSRTSQFWSPFVKNSQIDDATKAAIEAQLEDINAQIIEAHGTFKGVREHLAKVQELVALGGQDVVSVDAVPARVFDMLNRTQVSIASSTGARLPIGRHGEGTQSLTVLMLFDAFLKSELARKQGVKESKPIVALEEPEAHLHPNAVRALWKTIRDIDGQKFIATHSGDLLSEVELTSIRRIYKSRGQVKVGAIVAGVLDARDQRKFDFLVRRTRGELFFARCWLLGEGETEAILFSGVAEVLGLDLEQAGVRCVEYRLGDIDYFLDAANALGIAWHCLTDADAQGASDAQKAVDRIPETPKRTWRHMSVLVGSASIEPYLAANGFLDVYEAIAVPAKKAAKLTAAPGTPGYSDQIIKCIPDKPSAAYAVVEAMRQRGAASVPKALRSAVMKAIALARRP
ncbi:ATP-dependent nuclease [Roseateles sp. BYS87W]|uniref:ATP-dependent endonuclease n=1 Tax=Pelomonas baiyunensis TaxID=3299026 RepID=A0ABW7GXR3_9BURK